MGATYTRQSTYADGDTITAAHTNDEFNQLLAAFQASTGHTHDGTDNEGGPVTKLLGNALTFGAATAGTDITITFDGETNDGVLKWMEDEDYFEFSDDILIASTEKLQFRDTAIYINSSTDGQLDLVADSEIQIAATTIDINGAVDISGNLTVNGTLDLADGNFTNLGSIALDTITNDGTDITLDSSGDIILDAGGANITFKDDGTSILDIANSSTDVELTVSTADKNFKIKGTDSSSAITALDIDMALAGKATFNGDVVVGGDLTITGDDLVMGTNTSGHILVADGTNFNPVAVGDLSEISTVANDDVFLAVDTSGGGLKKITRSAVVSGLATSSAISNIVEDTSPQLGANLDTNSHNILIDDAHFIADENGNEQVIFQTTSSAVNQFDITNAATGNSPELSATGGDTNISLKITPKGSGQVLLDGNVGVESGLIDLKNSGSRSQIKFYCESSNAHAQTLQAAPHSEAASNTLTLPSTGGSVDLVSTASTATLTNKTLTSPKINEDVAVTSTATELNVLDGITAVVGELNALDLGSTAVGTAIASKAVILDSNKDYTGIRNFTITGEIDAATGDFSGAVDVAGATTTTTITASGIIKTDDTTDATSTTDGSLQTDGGLSVAKDAIIGDDLKLLSDSSVLSLGAGSDATFTHDGTTGLTIAATPISIDSTGELHLNSTTGDIKLQDGGTDQIIFDLDGTAGAVIIKPATDSDDIVFQQYDGTAVMTVEDNVSLAINNDITVAGRASGHVTTDNDGSFDLSVGNDFICTSGGNLAITFTNAAAGQSGNIKFVNGSNHTITAHADVAINADVLTTISASGTYHLAYFCSAASGNDTILVSASAILT